MPCIIIVRGTMTLAVSHGFGDVEVAREYLKRCLPFKTSVDIMELPIIQAPLTMLDGEVNSVPNYTEYDKVLRVVGIIPYSPEGQLDI